MSLSNNYRFQAWEDARPFWLPGSTHVMKMGAYMLRYQHTNGPVSDAEVGDMLWRKGAKTKFANVNNVAVWFHNPSVDDGGWTLYAFTKTSADPLRRIQPSQVLSGVRNAAMIASRVDVGGVGPLGDLTLLTAGPTLGGQLLNSRLIRIEDETPADVPEGTTGGVFHGGGFVFDRYDAESYLMDMTPCHYVDGLFRMNGMNIAWNGGGRPGATSVKFACDFPWSSQKVNPDDPQSATIRMMGVGTVSFNDTSAGPTLRGDWPTFSNRFLGGAGLGLRTDEVYVRPPIGFGWNYQPIGFLHGISPFVKHYAEKDDSAFLHLLWSASEVVSVMTVVHERAAADEKVQMASIRDHFTANPGQYLRALVWDKATKGPDIYTQSAIADALAGGADLDDINKHVVDGKTLAEWRAICAAAKPSAVWAGITCLGDQTAEAKPHLTSGAGRVPGSKGLYWTLPAPKQDQPVRVAEGTAQEIITQQLLEHKGNVPLSQLLSLASFNESLQVALDSRAKGETTVNEDEFRFVARSTELQGLEPWRHLGDLWWQHVRSSNMVSAVSGFTSSALQFAPSSWFGSGA